MVVVVLLLLVLLLVVLLVVVVVVVVLAALALTLVVALILVMRVIPARVLEPHHQCCNLLSKCCLSLKSSLCVQGTDGAGANRCVHNCTK